MTGSTALKWLNMPDTVVSDIFCYPAVGLYRRQTVKDRRHQVCTEMAYSEFIAYKQHFDSRGFENIWTEVCELPIAGHMFFSSLVMVYSRLPCAWTFLPLFPWRPKEVWRILEPLCGHWLCHTCCQPPPLTFNSPSQPDASQRHNFLTLPIRKSRWLYRF